MRKKIPTGIIGMVHLKALPGSPNFAGDLSDVERIAIADASTLLAGGVDAILVENFGDVPFQKKVDAVTIAAMTRIVRSIVEMSSVPVGVNVLRNDPHAAIAIASSTGACFIRVNVHIGAMVTDQGLIEGEAAETLRLRDSLSSDIAILADVGVKHATPFDEKWSLEQEAKDAWHRGLADALIVSGNGTGTPTSRVDIERVKHVVQDAPLIVGSGVTCESLPDLSLACAWIVGTALKRDGKAENEVELAQVLRLTDAKSSTGDC
ncbi:MAG: phosphorybosylanthranilate isomerase [Euryarchaeota archaeon]|nr:phosphorybosylanthranilate isomerase [Euryarchaeota archaeon]|tara:strand:- start:316 stop:1107 length:792 start_codon:yes stop_codon:yes gene_type:complete